MEGKLPKQVVEQVVLKRLRTNTLKPAKLGQERDLIREQAMIEASYEQNGEKKLQEKLNEDERKEGKGMIRVYGYKHPKAFKFYSQLLRCLKDCYEMKFEQLNIDMNMFLLLKNELSLHFLRQTENIVQTVKLALRIYASEDEQKR
jgi:hypothetical protein